MRRRFVSKTIGPVVVVLCLFGHGCKESSTGTDPAATSSSTLSSGTPPAQSAPQALVSALAPVAPQPLQLLKFTFSSDVKNKQPVDTLEAAAPGQRVWGHFVLRNRNQGSRKLSVVFRVNGQTRTTLDLEIEKSWSFRTYAFNTLRSADKTGEISLEAKDETGAIVASSAIPIRATSVKKPLPKSSPPDSD